MNFNGHEIPDGANITVNFTDCDVKITQQKGSWLFSWAGRSDRRRNLKTNHRETGILQAPTHDRKSIEWIEKYGLIPYVP